MRISGSKSDAGLTGQKSRLTFLITIGIPRRRGNRRTKSKGEQKSFSLLASALTLHSLARPDIVSNRAIGYHADLLISQLQGVSICPSDRERRKSSGAGSSAVPSAISKFASTKSAAGLVIRC